MESWLVPLSLWNQNIKGVCTHCILILQDSTGSSTFLVFVFLTGRSMRRHTWVLMLNDGPFFLIITPKFQLQIHYTMSDHVTSLCKSVKFLLWNLARIQRFIDHNAASNAMRAFILSKLDYGNALLSSCKNKDVARLQCLQNQAARIVFQVARRHSSSLLLASLQWLPIDKRIKFKILLHIYKALNDLSPVYLTECIAIHLPSREGLRSGLRSSVDTTRVDTTCLVVPRSTRRIGDRSFSVYGPSLWNQLPISIRSSSTVCTFKHGLKTHMF